MGLSDPPSNLEHVAIPANMRVERIDSRNLAKISGWPIHDWHILPPPVFIDDIELTA